jgi:hypothetical protein
MYLHITYLTVERVHWLRAKAQFERWVEEQDSIHNEANWIPAYFHAKSEAWRKLMICAFQGSLKGHASYASHQMHAWEELSRSAAKALSPITDSPLKHFKVHSMLLA